MEYKDLSEDKAFVEATKIVSSLGYSLVDFKVVPQKTQKKVSAVITHGASQNSEGIGINDCAKVHRLLLARMEVVLGTDDIYMEVTSPGTERNIKNAAEFASFVGQNVRIWSVEKSDWIIGKVLSSDKTAVELSIEGENSSVKIPYEKIAKAKLYNL